jgi:hypothetical protein
MDKNLKGKIISALRRISYSWKPMIDAKNAQKRDIATYECQACNIFTYEGKRSLEATGLSSKYPDRKVEAGRVYRDHINPVVPIEGFPGKEWSWDIYIDRMFPEDRLDFQILCKSCNSLKTAEENKQRREIRKKRKK